MCVCVCVCVFVCVCVYIYDRMLDVPQSRCGRNGEDKFLALMGSNLSDKHAFCCCTKCALMTLVMIVISKHMELSTL
jgi:hypothetical protein